MPRYCCTAGDTSRAAPLLDWARGLPKEDISKIIRKVWADIFPDGVSDSVAVPKELAERKLPFDKTELARSRIKSNAEGEGTLRAGRLRDMFL